MALFHRDLTRRLARLIMHPHGPIQPSQPESHPFLEFHIAGSVSSELENCSCRKHVFELSLLRKSAGTDDRNCRGARQDQKLQGMPTPCPQPPPAMVWTQVVLLSEQLCFQRLSDIVERHKSFVDHSGHDRSAAARRFASFEARCCQSSRQDPQPEAFALMATLTILT